MANNNNEDHNHITLLILIGFAMRAIFMIIVVYTIVYFTGLVWLDISMKNYEVNKADIEQGTTK